MTDTEQTTDHDTIRAWVTKRQGYPAHVKATQDGEDAGMLMIGFQNPDGKLEEIDWSAFFEKFEEEKLAFLYQEKTDEGELSRFNRLVSRD